LRRDWRSNRVVFLSVSLLLCVALIITSQLGLLGPLESLASIPLNVLSGVFNRIALSFTDGITDVAELQSLRQRNADLEEALAQFQGELVELREISSDYQRLADLLNYTTQTTEQEFLAADVISIDQSGFLRTITLNRGTRDGISIGMPVVTDQGLVGRITEVSANASRVLLVSDQSSAISARLQTSRVEGSVIGQLSGVLRMTFIPIGESIQVGDLVLTSGLGGNFPPDVVIGQVTSKLQLEFETFQEAEVRSLINFDTLEIVLIVTNFQPVDLSVFEDTGDDTTAGAGG
jgi:rod shape-determining protein MreC